MFDEVLENLKNLRLDSPEPPEDPFKFLFLPSSVQRRVLGQMGLENIIQLSFCSQRTKRIISLSSQIDKSQSTCTILFNARADQFCVTSPFGCFTSSLEHSDHVLEVLNYPYVGVVIEREQALYPSIEWLNEHKGLVTSVMYLAEDPHFSRILPFVNQMIECGVRINFHGDMVIDGSLKDGTVQIINPNRFFMPYIWGIKCRYLLVTTSGETHHGSVSKFGLQTWQNFRCPLSRIERVIFELTDLDYVEGKLENQCKKSEKEFKHPIYGKIKECYKIRDENEWKEATLFKTEHDGKQLLVMDIQYFVALDIIEKNLDFMK
ncbi:unnamed protein product [Caenorhabditis brenneri]